MYIKAIAHSASPFNLMQYLVSIKEKRAQIIASNGIDLNCSIATIAKELTMVSSMCPNVKKFIGHYVISFSPDDSVDKKLMEEIGVKFIIESGIGSNQYLLVSHHDKAHGHMHLAYNRVSPTGHLVDDSFSALKAMAFAIKMEERHNLTPARTKVNQRKQEVIDIIRKCINEDPTMIPDTIIQLGYRIMLFEKSIKVFDKNSPLKFTIRDQDLADPSLSKKLIQTKLKEIKYER